MTILIPSRFDSSLIPDTPYYIEVLTRSVAEAAWKLFLEVEDKGGFAVVANAGEVQQAVNESNSARKKQIATRRISLLGTNIFPNFTEIAGNKIEADSECGCHCHKDSEIAKLDFSRGASEFEALRLETEKSGKRPKVFMLTIGNLAMRLARSQFSSNFFACAGYEIFDNLGFETVEAGVKAAREKKADIIVLCSSDDEYATFAPEAFKLTGNKEFPKKPIFCAPPCWTPLKNRQMTLLRDCLPSGGAALRGAFLGGRRPEASDRGDPGTAPAGLGLFGAGRPRRGGGRPHAFLPSPAAPGAGHNPLALFRDDACHVLV